MISQKPSKSLFERFALAVAKASGSSYAFFTALIVVVLWLLSGPLFGYSDTWQLVINTSTTIVTFLMVFLIQKSQNLDSLAFKLKLNELIASQKNASNRLLDVEDLSEAEMEILVKFYVLLSRKAEKEMAVHESHSIEEAEFLHRSKKQDDHQIRRQKPYKPQNLPQKLALQDKEKKNISSNSLNNPQKPKLQSEKEEINSNVTTPVKKKKPWRKPRPKKDSGNGAGEINSNIPKQTD